jgi:DNA (cytosine-5)-methyltransferase 1
MTHLFNYKWFLKDGYPETNGLNVFGTFICGGGSTMGYKLAGYNHLGGVEIDKNVADVYDANHKPKYLYNEDIREFNKRTDLPKELYELDILDGSPPCSTFSMAGSREKAWGKEKQFREGQALQTLDDLVFVYCDTVIKLQPKVFILENVKGIIQGNAKLYSKQIVKKMTDAGYTVQVFLLNAASMGVPQKRERVFFIGYRNELKFPKLKLEFHEVAIAFGEYRSEKGNETKLTDRQYQLLKLYQGEKTLAEIEIKRTGKNSGFTDSIVKDIETPQTITSAGKNFRAYDKQWFSDNDFKCTGSYPLDYNFKKIEPKYLIGMSVPPVMTAQIANQIKIQWLYKFDSTIKKTE